jgi:hypothetical protein
MFILGGAMLFLHEIASGALQTDDYGNLYRDFYTVVSEHQPLDEESVRLLLQKLHSTFSDYPAKTDVGPNPEGERKRPLGFNTSAPQGNFFEALNISVNAFQDHYVDRNMIQ